MLHSMTFAEHISKFDIHIIDLQELNRLRNTHQKAFVKNQVFTSLYQWSLSVRGDRFSLYLCQFG